MLVQTRHRTQSLECELSLRPHQFFWIILVTSEFRPTCKWPRQTANQRSRHRWLHHIACMGEQQDPKQRCRVTASDAASVLMAVRLGVPLWAPRLAGVVVVVGQVLLRSQMQPWGVQ